MDWKIVPGYGRTEDLRELLTAYTAMLVREEPAMAPYLDQQGYEAELAHLERKYGHPDGRLYVVLVQDKAVGCIALRRLDERRCEMKRLYVEPAFRGRGIARALVRQLIADARVIGYERMLLDTVPFLREAIALYESEGFRQIERYNDSPLEQTCFYGLDL